MVYGESMRVLLTGGSGFLGSYVAEQLCAEGHTVRALVRPRSDKRVLQKLGACEFAPGAIEDRASVRRLLEDSDVPLCLDTGHLLIGGTDPVELIATVPERIAHVRACRRWDPAISR